MMHNFTIEGPLYCGLVEIPVKVWRKLQPWGDQYDDYEHGFNARESAYHKRQRPLKRKTRKTKAQRNSERVKTFSLWRRKDRRLNGVNGVDARMALDCDRWVQQKASALFDALRSELIVHDGTKRNVYSVVFDFDTGELLQSHTLGLGAEVWAATERSLKRDKRHNLKLLGFYNEATAKRIHKAAENLRKELARLAALPKEYVLTEVEAHFKVISEAKRTTALRYGTA